MRKAVDGDHAALRLCLDRTLAPRSAADQRGGRHRGGDGRPPRRRGAGRITAGEAHALSQTVETYLRAIETSDFDRRLSELEEARAAETGRQ